MSDTPQVIRGTLPTVSCVTALLCASLFSWQPALADSTTLIVEIAELRNSTGMLRFSLYNDAETFRKEERAYRRLALPASAGKTTLIVENLPPGRYAAMAYHDENDNGKLDLRFGMFPTEGYALSNNPKVVGPPRFSDSAFDFPATGNAPLRMTVSY